MADRTELEDLSGKCPEIVEELSGLHADWTDRCQVQPWRDILESRDQGSE